jgi:hypothetical protein
MAMRIAPTMALAFWTTMLTLALVGPASAQSAIDSIPPPPNPPESSGALMVERFVDLHAWRPDTTGVWTVERGVLAARLPDKPQQRSLIFAGSKDWQDYAVDLDVLQWRGVDKGLVVRASGSVGIGVDLRGGELQDVMAYRREVPLGHAQAANPDRKWHHLRIEARANHYSVLVDGKLVLRCHDKLPGARRGRIALAAYTGGKGACAVFYSNVVVTALVDQP